MISKSQGETEIPGRLTRVGIPKRENTSSGDSDLPENRLQGQRRSVSSVFPWRRCGAVCIRRTSPKSDVSNGTLRDSRVKTRQHKSVTPWHRIAQFRLCPLRLDWSKWRDG